jgi:hypothetical protein
LILGKAAQVPCPALTDEMHCGLMDRPQDYRPEQARLVGIEAMREAAKRLIGAGAGCPMKSPDERPNPNFHEPFLRLSRKEITKALAVWGYDREEARNYGLSRTHYAGAPATSMNSATGTARSPSMTERSRSIQPTRTPN